VAVHSLRNWGGKYLGHYHGLLCPDLHGADPIQRALIWLRHRFDLWTYCNNSWWSPRLLRCEAVLTRTRPRSLGSRLGPAPRTESSNGYVAQRNKNLFEAPGPYHERVECTAIQFLRIRPLRTHWAKLSASQLRSAYFSAHPNKSTMSRVRSVGIVSQQGVGIAAIAGSESDVLRAGRLRWGRTIAICVAKPSSHRADSKASRVFTH
jgi:hypothetical protein